MAGKAQTGTGKTAAFLVTIFSHILNRPLPGKKRKAGVCRSLVLAPTRELAIQIHKDAEIIGKFCGLNLMAVYGGLPIKQQRDCLRQPIDLLVGTPGRILDFLRSRDLDFSCAEFLVIDEADRMLDMGFIPDVRRIVSNLPDRDRRQTLFFSATLTGDILRLIDHWLNNPLMIDAEPKQIVTDLIEQKFYSVAAADKFKLLLWFLRNDGVERALIFVNRRTFTESLSRKLRDRRIECEILSGDVPQKQRLRILEAFREGKIRILVATDVAARGIHVENVTHVFNYDMPVRTEEYVHRIGRTGRAGEKGKSITFVCEYGAYAMPELETFLGTEIVCEIPDEKMLP
jgi:ATP-dependent RNA helicase RhlB